MSLEQAVQENTAALRELIVLLTLQNKGAVHANIVQHAEEKHGVHGGEGATLPKASAAAKPAAETAKAAASKAVEQLADVMAHQHEIKAAAAEAKNPPDFVDRVWTYRELADDFLLLVKSDKPKALAILASLKVETLKPFQDQPAFFPAIAAKLWEARNG